MNFFVRNLGWVLLALFFVFMLFLISSNDGEMKKPVTQTGEVQTSTGEENLESLVEKMENQEDVQAEQEDEKLSLWERIFGKREEKVPTDSITSTGETTQTGELAQTGSKIKTQIPPTTQPVGKTAYSQNSWNLVKDTVQDSPTSAPLKKTEDFTSGETPKETPKESTIVPSIGKKYTVAVPALKLNNKNFDTTIGYLYKGDVLEQISPAGSDGCFEVKVLHSKNTPSLGKQGYVCKRYLSEATVSDEDGTPKEVLPWKQEEPSIDLSIYPQTQIGDIITITRSAQLVLKEYTDLAAWDTIDQMTNFDAQGCFIAHVYSSSLVSSRDMVGKICLKDIY